MSTKWKYGFIILMTALIAISGTYLVIRQQQKSSLEGISEGIVPEVNGNPEEIVKGDVEWLNYSGKNIGFSYPATFLGSKFCSISLGNRRS